MLRIFDRYLLQEVIYGWLAVTMVLCLILVSNRLVLFLADAASGDIAANVIFKLLGLKMVWYMVHIVPFALALGVVLGLGRLYRDNEMTVMSACGVGVWRIYKPLLGFGLVVAALLTWLALFVSPEIQGVSSRLTMMAEEQADLTLLGAGRFNEIQDGKLTFYAEKLSADKQRMENLFIEMRNQDDDSKLPQLLTAKSAYRKQDAGSNDSFLVLVDGYRYEGTPGTANYRIARFAEYGVRIELPAAAEVVDERESTPTAVLAKSADRKDIAELQWRIMMPVSVMVLLILAVPLSQSTPRQGRYGRLVVAVLLFVIYYNLMGVAEVWVKNSVVPPAIGMWWVAALPLLLATVLLRSRPLLNLLGRGR
ncbi:MAG: LPS export ABC transporter permease LptF [Gammaproteobacteria bacterium]|nr:LPS export ABC transporter permease LptF [Gammaproteobacteria bacterium]